MSATWDRVEAVLRESLSALQAPDALWAEVGALHSRGQRDYHGPQHLAELAEHYAQVAAGPGWSQAPEVALALLYHDAVYTPSFPGSEQASAVVCEEAARRFALDLDARRSSQLIRWTAEHGRIEVEEASDADAAHFLDADMAILGAEPARFDEYQRQVAAEYTHIGRWAYRVGRRRFLRGLARRPRLYHSAFFRQRYEERARANLRRSLGWFGGGRR